MKLTGTAILISRDQTNEAVGPAAEPDVCPQEQLCVKCGTMILNNVEQVLTEFNATLAYRGASRSDLRTAQKGLELISSLQSSAGPQKWIEYGGHLTLVLYHAPRLGIDGKRAIPQVIIEPRAPSLNFGEIRYLLPTESRPWEYVSGIAKDISAAAAMIIDALARCEQRSDHLYESIAFTPAPHE